ncbi:MAG: hypothetical protein H6Q65_1422 [Firmicutes bacterium]|nr:hypothetical protein [Bacillota bacterium]
MYVCEICSKKISPKQKGNIIARKSKLTGKTTYLCRSCFEKNKGLDYDTYVQLKSRTKVWLLGIVLVIIAVLLLIRKFSS